MKKRLSFSSPLTIKNRIKEQRLFKRRLFVAVLLIAVLCFFLLARLFSLQVIERSYYSTLSKQNAISLVPMPPKRGLIYSRSGLLLAKNIPVFSLVVTPDKVGNLKQELKQVQQLIPLSPIDLEAFHKQLRFCRPFEQVPLKLKLTPSEVAIFAVNRYRFPGFSVKAELIRQYPFNDLFAHVIGYVGRINQQELSTLNQTNYADTNYIGKTGIEKYYEATLHGSVGYQRIETDASGRTVRVLHTIPPISGTNLYLTIDTGLQKASYQAMQGYNGAVIALQPMTGQVLAMVSTPSFNPNQFVTGISEANYLKLEDDKSHPLYNRAIHGLYSIGSTIKPIIGLEGLETGVITPKTTIFDPGWFRLPHSKHIFHDWLRGGHGWVDLHKAIVVSCDTYFYILGFHLGIGPIDHILKEFGFGQLTGIGLPNEAAGIIPSPSYKMAATGKPWYTGDTVNTAIGQGFLQTTALQLADEAATLANRGKRFAPTLIYALQAPNQPIIYPSPQPLKPIDITNPNYWREIISAMQDIILHGTGYHFGRPPYTVAAKTGTAQVRSDHGKRAYNLPKDERSNSTFIAFAPINKPQIAIAVIVEHDPDAAVRVARKVMDYYLLTQHHWRGNFLNKS